MHVIPRILSILSITLCIAAATVRAGEQPLQKTAPDVWSTLAGMTEELQGQTLELRDELISAHLAYLTALEKALAELDELGTDDSVYPLAWARAEYLLETSFRLLESTGEYDAFLKTTQPLKPEPVPAPDPVALEADEKTDTLDGDLEYFDAKGNILVPKSGENGLVLVNAETGKPTAPDGEIIARPKTTKRQNESAHIPLIKARAAWLRAITLERLGRTREAGAETAALGLIRDWVVMGPMETVSEEQSYLNYGLDDVYAGMDSSAPILGKNGPIRWKPVGSLDPLGRMFPGSMFRSDGLKSALNIALVHSDADQPAVMRFGATASTVVCVNHTLARRTRYFGLADPDREAFSVWMRKGWNIVLVRTSSITSDWAFAARLTAIDGSPFPGYVAKPDESTMDAFFEDIHQASRRSILERFYSQAEPEAGGVSILSGWLADNPEDARANFYLASFLVAKRLMEGPDRFDRELVFRHAMDYSGGDPFFVLMAARSVDSGMDGPDREENLRLVLLKSVADRGSAAALADIGRLYLDIMRQPRRADEYADMALSVNPMSLRAGVLDYDVAVDMGWGPVARTLLEKLVKRHPSAAAARLRLGRAALAAGRHRQALSEFHAILAVDASNREALDGAVVALGMLGQTSAAVELLVSHGERFPYDFAVRLKLAELYRTLGRDGDARVVVEAALSLAADDPEALAMIRDLDRETYAEGKGTVAGREQRHRQELDPGPPRVQPPNGWEYLYFQVEDRMETSGAINRSISFALKIYTERAARMLRHLGMLLESGFEQSSVTRLELIRPDGRREPFTPPNSPDTNGRTVRFYLPPLQTGMAVEAEVRVRRDRVPFLGDYFGHIAPLVQQAPVRLSRYMFTSPKDRRVFFKPINGAPEAMIVNSPDGLESTRIWEMSNLPAFTIEPHSPGADALVPCVQVSSFGDWDEFARWYWRLVGVQYHSPPELREMAQVFGAGEKAPIGRLDRAARWIARNIGNRPWEYGPYAFRPINARSVLSRMSADSKDRTLLLCLFAREYGLEAWPVLARLRAKAHPTGSDELSLPLLDHFNYSLALVQSTLGGDVFLDAGNPFRPSGVMPSRLFGSHGIAVLPTGARIIVIPDGGLSACEWLETAELVIDEDGSILWQEEISGTGTAAETLRRRFENRDERPEAWTDFLKSIGGEPSAASDEFSDGSGQPAQANWKGRARLRRYATVEDSRVILVVPDLPGGFAGAAGQMIYPLGLEGWTRLGERTQDLVLPYGFRVARRISIRHPRDWSPVNPVRSFIRKYPFGVLSLTCETGPGSMDIDFSVEVPGHVIKAGDFDAFREMAAQAARWIRPELVWEKP